MNKRLQDRFREVIHNNYTLYYFVYMYTNNYRGFSVTSNLGKVFNKIIHERLMSFVKK